LAGLQNQLLEPASAAVVDMDMAFPRSVYKHKNAPDHLKILPASDDLVSLVNWCFE
jgi:hypothetical protein